MISVALLCWCFYKHKLRNLLLIILAGFLVLNFAPEKFFVKMERVKEGTREATAEERLYLWQIAKNIFRDYPIIGVGPYNYASYVLKYDVEKRFYHLYLDKGLGIVAHSTPLEWLAEMGIIGSLMLILLQICMYKNWRLVYKGKAKTLRSARESDEFHIFTDLTNACAISQIGFWCGALFLTLIIYPFYWILVPFSETWKNISLEYRGA